MTSLEIVERIRVLVQMLGEGDWEHRRYAEFLVLLEDGEDFCKRMEAFIGR